ncbi:transmembrane transporter [Perkinsus sp. BL_2016]|nr:transmembrane transporter [Perkinsus sp. BL_2016]
MCFNFLMLLQLFMRVEYWVLLASISCHSIWHVIGKAALTMADPEPFTFIFYRCLMAGVLLVTVAALVPGGSLKDELTKKRLLHMYPSLPSFIFMGLIYLCASVPLLPCALYVGGWGLEGESRVWLALGYCVVFATAFSYGGIAWASKRGVESTTVSIFITIEPFITAILSKIFLNTSPDKPVLFLICAALVAAGVILVLDKFDGNHTKYEPVEDSLETPEPSTVVGGDSLQTRRSISLGLSAKAQQPIQ